MFKVEPVYISDVPNDGDPFTITINRSLLKLMAAELNDSPAVGAQIMGAVIDKEMKNGI